MRSIIAGAAARRRATVGGASVAYDSGAIILAEEDPDDFQTGSFTIASATNRYLLGYTGQLSFSGIVRPTDVRQGSSGGASLIPVTLSHDNGTVSGRPWALEEPSTGSTSVWTSGVAGPYGEILAGLAYNNVERIGDVQYGVSNVGDTTSTFVEVTVATPNVGSLVAMYAWVYGENSPIAPVISTPSGDPGYTARMATNVINISGYRAFDRTRQGATTTVRVECSSYDNFYNLNLVAMVLEPTGAPWPTGSVGTISDTFPGSSLGALWDATPVGVATNQAITAGGTTSVSGGSLVMAPTDSAIRWTGASTELTNYNLQNAAIYCRPRVTGATAGGASTQWGFYFTVADGTSSPDLYAEFLIEDAGSVDGMRLHARYNNVGSTGTTTTITYNSTNHAYLRIRDSGGDLFWEASPTGARGSWTVIRQLSVDAGTAGTYAALSSCIVGLQTRNYGSATGVEMSVDGVNVT